LYNFTDLYKDVLAKGVGKKFLGKPTEKRPKNSPIKPPSTLSVLSMKIQGGHGSPSLPTPMVLA